MDAAPNGAERELGGKGATPNPFMDIPEPDGHNVIDLTGPGLEATKGEQDSMIIKDEDDSMMDEPISDLQLQPTQRTGDTLTTAVNLDDDSDEDGLFVRQTPERSAAVDDRTDTCIKREDDDRELALFAANPQAPQYGRPRYNNADEEDNDNTGLYAPPPDHDKSDEEIEEPPKDCIFDGLSAGTDEATPVAPRPRAKAVRAKTARDWHQREIEKRAASRNKRRELLHRAPTGPNKRFKKKHLTVKDEEGRKPRSDKEALQKAIGNLLYSHPMHARMGRDPSAQSFVENESAVIVTKKAYGEQAIREADCDKETAKKDWHNLLQAARQFGSKNKCVPTNDHKWKLVGVRFPLYHHQMLGVSWALAREHDPELGGGINADEMGLGKTIQALGTIASNAPEPEDINDGKRTTLIVVPSNLVRQWKGEIDLFLEPSHRGSVHIFKSKDDKSLLDLNFFDIIITTYNEVMRSNPSEKFKEKLYEQQNSPEEQKTHDEEQKKRILKELHEQHQGPLFKMDLWRVILDEAHTIKDPSSQTSIACRELKAKYRWALTGTPLHNNLAELWPYLSFLHVPWAKRQSDFGMLVGNMEQDLNEKQFKAMLDEVLQKRTSESRIFGKAPYVIPHCFVEKEIVPLSPEETVIYKFLEKKYDQARQGDDLELESQFQEEKKAPKGLDHVGIIIMRMRQTTVHPYLLESTISKEISKAEIQVLRGELAKLKDQSAVGDMVSSWSSTSAGLSIDGRLEAALAQMECTVCSFCGCEASDPQIADCSHTFCHECIDQAMVASTVSPGLSLKCPECSQMITGLRTIESDTTYDEEQAETASTASTGSLPSALSGHDSDMWARFLRFEEMAKSAKAPKGKDARGPDGKKLGNDFYNFQPGGKKQRSRFFEEADKQYPTEFPPSSKTTAIVESVLKWQNEAPDDKILIFTQFIAEKRIIGRLLQWKGIQFAYLVGDMPGKAKDRAIEGFKEEAKIKVLICSLAVGGVGLNLTCANRVILADPWWNVAIEAQAWCRVFRIGQRKKTYFKTVLMKGTIDVRIADLQDDKIKKIEAMMERNESFSMEQCQQMMHSVPSAEELDTLVVPA